MRHDSSVKIGIIILGCFFALLQLRAPAQESLDKPVQADRAVLYRVEGQLTQTMITSINRARRTSRSIDAKYLIVEIDTPGGEAGLMEQLRDIVFEVYQDDKLETVAYINPNADSAGALIAMACRRLYMAPLAHIGSAAPIAIPAIPFAPEPMPINEDLERKIKARFLAIFRATAFENGRNTSIAEAMVDADIELVKARIDGEEAILTREKFIDERTRLGAARAVELDVICESGNLLNITAQEAFDLGFIDGIPKSRSELFTSYLQLDEKDVVTIGRTWSENLVDFIKSISWLLLVAGLVFLYIEFKIPGFGVPGIIGLSCLAVLFFSQWLAGLAEITDILLIIIGLGLVATEIFLIPGTVVAGAVGFILIVTGAILSFQPFRIPDSPWEAEMLKSNVINMGLSILTFFAVAMILTRFLPKTSIFRRLVLDTGKLPGSLTGTATEIDDVHEDTRVNLGDEGTALNELRPVGKIMIGGSQLDAQSEGEYIEQGDKVRVVRIMGNFIFVRKVEDEKA
jgi:membrane-bound serine protease (ClpP class)